MSVSLLAPLVYLVSSALWIFNFNICKLFPTSCVVLSPSLVGTCPFFPRTSFLNCWAVCRQRIHSSLVFFVLISGSSAYFFAAFSGSPYIPWQDFQSCSCNYIVSDICSCLWGGNASYVQAFIFLLPAHRLSDWSSHFDNQVIPQAICTRYGLAVGASFVWLVRIVMFIAYPIAYPIGKVNQQSHFTQYPLKLIQWPRFWIPMN